MAATPNDATAEAAFSTDVYKQQLAKADQVIAQIVHANMARGK